MVNIDAPGIVELTVAVAETAPGRDECAIGGKPLDTVILAVGYQQMPVRLKDQAGGAVKLAGAAALVAPLAEKLARPC